MRTLEELAGIPNDLGTLAQGMLAILNRLDEIEDSVVHGPPEVDSPASLLDGDRKA